MPSDLLPRWALTRHSNRFNARLVYTAALSVAFFVVVCLVFTVATPPAAHHGTRSISLTASPASTSMAKNWMSSTWWPSQPSQPLSKSATLLSHDKPLTIAVTEHWGTHDEVVAPLVAAFGSIPGANITSILLSALDRFGATEMYNNLILDSLNPVPEPVQYEDDAEWQNIYRNPPDFIVSASCSWEYIVNMMPLLSTSNTHFFCVVHMANWWGKDEWNDLEDRWTPWIAADRMDFIVLSPHIAKPLAQHLSTWTLLKDKQIMPRIHSWAPVFEIEHAEIEPEQNSVSFALQGDYMSTKRDFGRVFRDLGHVTDSLVGQGRETKPYIHLVGSGERPEVPAQLEQQVVFDEELEYTAFYRTLGRMNALLPAFADDEYVTTKASSSIPAALIAGAPIVVTRKVMDAYSYLEEDAVWIQRDDQTEKDVMTDIAHKSPAELKKKTEKARALGKKLIRKAKDDAAGWIDVVLQQRQKRADWFEQRESFHR